MAFRKRNTVISAGRQIQLPVQSKTDQQLPEGLRPSPLDGRLTTSTGTSSLDYLLAGHGGLPLGTCLLIEEQGTADFASLLLRYYAAEGLVQGHQVHIVGFGQAWKNELPALDVHDGKSKAAEAQAPTTEKMKIAWRYEALGNASRGSTRTETTSAAKFCHSFDLTKRLTPASCKGSLQPTPAAAPLALDSEKPPASPFKLIVEHIRAKLENSEPGRISRLIIPSLLSPTLYGPGCCQPNEVLQFLHAVRALLRQYSRQLTALVTLPVSLFPRSGGLTRWIELICDGVIELIPLPANPVAESRKPSDKSVPKEQGHLKVHKLPIYHEKGGGGAENAYFRENLLFHMSASKGMVIKPFSLPPLGEEDQKENQTITVKDGLDF